MREYLVVAVIPVMIGVKLGLNYLASTDTAVGRALADSDHEAWRMAVEDKQQELDELLSVEPRRR